MWFKNMQIFKLTRANFFSQINLELLLSANKFRQCGATEIETTGWVSALPGTENLVHSVDNNNFQLIRYCKETKILPADYVRREVDKKVKAIEFELCRKATKKEKEAFKETLVFDCLPAAFPTQKYTEIYTDNKNQLLIINTGTRSAAEDVLALLRKSIGTLPVTDYFTSEPLQQCLNHWIDGQRDVESNFKLGGNVQFSESMDAPAQAKFTNEVDIQAPCIRSFVTEEDRDVNYLSVEFDDAFFFTIHAKGFLKGVKPSDVLKEQNDDIDSDDHLARVDADFVLFAKEMGRLFNVFDSLNITDQTERDTFDASTISYPDIKSLEEEFSDEMQKFGVAIESAFLEENNSGEDQEDGDTLIEEATAFVVEERRASISSIQRKFRIGYNRSARIMEQLQINNIVSEPGHNGAREVLI